MAALLKGTLAMSRSRFSRRALMAGTAAFGVGLSLIQTRPLSAQQGKQHRVTPQDFGASGNGLNDDSPAISEWLDHILERSIVGYVPAGDYVLNTIVRKKLAGIVRAGIVGDGSQVSRFIVSPSNRNGGFEIDGYNSRRHQLRLEGFSVIATASHGVGFRFILPEGGNQHQRSLTAEDVWCRSADKRTNSFHAAFDFTGCWRPRLENCGWDGPFIDVDDSNDSPRYFCKTAFILDGCYGLTMEDCYAWGCGTGIRSGVYVGKIADITQRRNGRVRVRLANGPMPFSDKVRVSIAGTRSYNGVHRIARVDKTSFDIKAPFAGSEAGVCSLALGPEGMNIKDLTINGVKNGIWVQRPNGREPTCWITGNHINYRDFGIMLDGVKILQADQNNTYNEDKDTTFPGTPKDFDLRNVSEYIISGHVFHFDGHARRVGIRVASDTRGEGDNGLIHHCIFTGQFQTAIHLTADVSGVQVGPNLYPGKITQRVWDENGSNTVL